MTPPEWPTFRLDDPLPEGMLCLEASAGTGKTYTMEGLVARLVAEGGVSIDKLLVVTFTRAATAELRTRIRRVLDEARRNLERVQQGLPHDPHAHRVVALLVTLPDPSDAIRRLKRALEGFDEARISTIHGFCQQALQEHAFESGVPFDVELAEGIEPLLEELAQDWWSASRHDADPFMLAHLAARDVDVSLLTKTAKALAGSPDAPLVPAPPDPSVIARGVARWTQAVEQFRDVWLAGVDDVVDALVAARAAKELKAAFSPDKIETRRAKLDAWFSGPYLSPLGGRDIAHFGSELINAETAVAAQKKGVVVTHPLLAEVDAFIAEWDAAMAVFDAGGLLFMHRFCAFVEAELARRKAERRLLSFDDLLRALHQRVTGPSANPKLVAALRERYQVALIDEFQDTDACQWGIFEAVFSGGSHGLFVVGDPKQAIYSFRGADIQTYLDARSHGDMAVSTLGTNHRSDRAVVDGIAHLFSNPAITHPFMNPGIHFPKVSASHVSPRFTLGPDPAPGVVLHYLERGAMNLRGASQIDGYNFRPEGIVAAQIVDFLTSGATVLDDEGQPRDVNPSDVAVLVRSNKHARHMQAALRVLGVPSTLRNSESVFRSEEASSLVRVLEAVLDPARGGVVRSALVTSLLGQDVQSLARLETDESAWDEWVQRLRDWRKTWVDKGFSTFARQLTTTTLPEPKGVARQTIPGRVLRWRDGERRVTNLLHLLEALQEAVLAERLAPHGLVAWMHRQIGRAEEGRDDERQLRLESDQEAVNISTIHKSKGLQYGFVWCPTLWSESRVSKTYLRPLRFRDPRLGGQWCLDIDIDVESDSKMAHKAYALESVAEEDLRVLYVALTRAKHQVHVLTGPMKKLGLSPLGYLLYPGEGAPEKWADGALLGTLQTLAGQSDGDVAVQSISTLPVPQVYPRAGKTMSLASRSYAFRAGLDRYWRRASFSGLVKGGKSSGDEAPVQDYDAESEDGERLADVIESTVSPVVEPGADDSRSLVLGEFPGGVRTGNCLHEIFEVHDFTRPELLDAVVRSKLTAYNYDADTHAEVVKNGVQTALDTPLGLTPDLCLADVPMDRRFNELDFTFALPGESTQQPIKAAAIANLMRKHGEDGIPEGYAKALQSLDFVGIRGFMIGSIDLIFEHAGRWYVVDYKSNFLGKRPADYTPSRLAKAMSHSHYVLQYHIYCVALHRLLRWRMGSAYRFSDHFGGALYLFLRGMSPDHALGTGIFRDAPSEALIEGLSQLLGGAK